VTAAGVLVAEAGCEMQRNRFTKVDDPDIRDAGVRVVVAVEHLVVRREPFRLSEEFTKRRCAGA
jgi:hypothetical protein